MTTEPTLDINPDLPHPARMYDYLLGGTTNFEADRAAVRRASEVIGGEEIAKADVRANRDFLRRAVQAMAADGIGQFIDIGCGIPNGRDDAHTIAFDLVPDARVVSVDNDPIVLANAHHLLRSPKGSAGFVHGDLRDAAHLLAEAATTLDLTQPVGLLLVAVLHFLPDADDPVNLTARLVGALAPGSQLAITHLSSDLAPIGLFDALNTAGRDTFTARSADDLAPFLDGLELLDPGLVPVHRWRPDPTDSPLPAGQEPSFLAVLARKDPQG